MPIALEGSWLRFWIKHGEARQIGLGVAPCFRRVGVCVVQVFVPEGEASARALQLADQVVAALQAKQVTAVGGTVEMQTSSVDEVGPDRRGWWQVNVSTPFRYVDQP